MKDAKQKKLSYRLIEREEDAGAKIYALMDELVVKFHEDITQANIALAWNLSWKPDIDGSATLGKCRKVGSLDRELMAFDFVIILLREFWESADVSDDQRRALLDHQLCHGAVVLDKNGEPVEDERGRKVYRMRKHDIEEFSQVVERHGTYERDLEKFAKALQKSKQGKLFPPNEAQPGPKAGSKSLPSTRSRFYPFLINRA